MLRDALFSKLGSSSLCMALCYVELDEVVEDGLGAFDGNPKLGVDEVLDDAHSSDGPQSDICELVKLGKCATCRSLCKMTLIEVQPCES